MDTNYNIKVAIKKLKRPFQSAVGAKRTYRELRLLKHMNHENVIGLLDVFHPGGNTIDLFQQVYLCTHLMGADLNNIIRTQRLSDDHVQFLVYQILRGLKYIHSAGIIHRVCVCGFFFHYFIMMLYFVLFEIELNLHCYIAHAIVSIVYIVYIQYYNAVCVLLPFFFFFSMIGFKAIEYCSQ